MNFDKVCPFCAETIREGAIKCRFCGEFLVSQEQITEERNQSVVSDDWLVSVVVPAYNEESSVKSLLEQVAGVALNKEIIVVDDFSSDGTRNILQHIEKNWKNTYRHKNNLRIFYHEKNQGKGAAIRTGFEQVGGKIVIIQDADLEYDPQEYFRLIQPIVEGKADVVYGSRFIGEVHRVLNFWHYKGNKILTTLSNIFTDLKLTDMETCYKVFRTEVIRELKLKENRFGIEPEITAKVARMNCRIYEVPISYHGRDYTQGKKIGWKDGIRAIYSILKYNLFS